VAGRVDQVHQKRARRSRSRRASGRSARRVEKRDGRRLHRDAAVLLVLAEVHVAQLAHHLGVHQAVVRDERVAQRCLAVINVRKHAQRAHATRRRRKQRHARRRIARVERHSAERAPEGR
jgi:hypothetical protein